MINEKQGKKSQKAIFYKKHSRQSPTRIPCRLIGWTCGAQL